MMDETLRRRIWNEMIAADTRFRYFGAPNSSLPQPATAPAAPAGRGRHAVGRVFRRSITFS